MDSSIWAFPISKTSSISNLDESFESESIQWFSTSQSVGELKTSKITTHYQVGITLDHILLHVGHLRFSLTEKAPVSGMVVWDSQSPQMTWHFRLVNDFSLPKPDSWQLRELCLYLISLMYFTISRSCFNIRPTVNHISPANLGRVGVRPSKRIHPAFGHALSQGPLGCRTEGEVWHFFFDRVADAAEHLPGYLCQPYLTLKSPSCLSNPCIILLRVLWNHVKSSGICFCTPETLRGLRDLDLAQSRESFSYPSLWNRLNRQRGRAEDSLIIDDVWHQQS